MCCDFMNYCLGICRQYTGYKIGMWLDLGKSADNRIVSQACGVLTKVLILYHMNGKDYISESKTISYKSISNNYH